MNQLARRSYYILLVLTLTAPLSLAHAGLIPCGNPAQGDQPAQPECTFAYLFELVAKIVHFLLFDLAVPLAAIAFAWAGIVLLTDGGNEKKRDDAKKIATAAVVGLGLAFAAWLIVNTIFSSLTNIQLPS